MLEVVDLFKYLAARLLKARYYPRTSFLKAGVGHIPSYLWSKVPNIAHHLIVSDIPDLNH